MYFGINYLALVLLKINELMMVVQIPYLKYPSTENMPVLKDG